VYCNRSCLWVCICVCVWVCYHDNSKLCASIFTKLVGEGGDHLKFWLSCTPAKGVCIGAKIFVSALVQPACNVCICLSTFFIINELGKWSVLETILSLWTWSFTLLSQMRMSEFCRPILSPEKIGQFSHLQSTSFLNFCYHIQQKTADSALSYYTAR